MSDLNSHIRMFGPMAMVHGNTVTYLSALRDTTNKHAIPASEQAQIRREKFSFVEFATKAGARSPRNIALIAGGMAQHAAPEVVGPIESFLAKAERGHYFCKPNKGSNGIGAFRLTLTADGVMMDEEPSTVGAVSERLSSEDYVIQEWMAPLQHPDISRFRDGVINTLRLITFKTGEDAQPVAASLRMAISLKSIDSWTQGGVVAAIDVERGILKPFGIVKKGAKLVEAHPGSGVPFRDQIIPHYQEAVRLACLMHNELEPRTLGWDIGLLKDGPCFLETNGPWDVLMSAQFNPDLVPKFLAVALPPTCDVAVHVLLPGLYKHRIPLCLGLSKVLGKSRTSGRIERLTRERIVMTIGGTQQAVRTALKFLQIRGPEFGASDVRVAPANTKPAPGFDVSGALVDAPTIQFVRPA